jgi:hypothetical protein
MFISVKFSGMVLHLNTKEKSKLVRVKFLVKNLIVEPLVKLDQQLVNETKLGSIPAIKLRL